MLEIIFTQIFFFFQILKTLLYSFLIHGMAAISVLIPATTPAPSHVCVCVCVCTYFLLWKLVEYVGKFHSDITSVRVFVFFVFFFFNPLSRKLKGFRGGSEVQNPTANVGDMGLIPGSGRSPGEGNGSPFQYSCLGKPLDKEAWQATVRGVAKESDTIWWLINN